MGSSLALSQSARSYAVPAGATQRSRIYRVTVVAKFEEAVYVLHCFQKAVRRRRDFW